MYVISGDIIIVWGYIISYMVNFRIRLSDVKKKSPR